MKLCCSRPLHFVWYERWCPRLCSPSILVSIQFTFNSRLEFMHIKVLFEKNLIYAYNLYTDWLSIVDFRWRKTLNWTWRAFDANRNYSLSFFLRRQRFEMVSGSGECHFLEHEKREKRDDAIDVWMKIFYWLEARERWALLSIKCFIKHTKTQSDWNGRNKNTFKIWSLLL